MYEFIRNGESVSSSWCKIDASALVDANALMQAGVTDGSVSAPLAALQSVVLAQTSLRSLIKADLRWVAYHCIPRTIFVAAASCFFCGVQNAVYRTLSH
jgi:hypothetical protein